MKKLLQLAFAIALAVSLNACDTSPDNDEDIATFEHLCLIYTETVRQPVEEMHREATIRDRVREELPVFYDQHYVDILTLGHEERYEAIRNLAQEQTGEDWECDLMERFYEGQFDMDLDYGYQPQ